jgi:hypothetical protein
VLARLDPVHVGEGLERLFLCDIDDDLMPH